MDIYAKILNKVLANQIEKYIKNKTLKFSGVCPRNGRLIQYLKKLIYYKATLIKIGCIGEKIYRSMEQNQRNKGKSMEKG